MDGPGRPVELGVAEREDASIGGHQPVTTSVRRHCHAHDGLVEMDGTGRPVELGVAEREDASIGGHQPVTTSVRRGRHAHYGHIQMGPCLLYTSPSPRD